MQYFWWAGPASVHSCFCMNDSNQSGLKVNLYTNTFPSWRFALVFWEMYSQLSDSFYHSHKSQDFKLLIDYLVVHIISGIQKSMTSINLILFIKLEVSSRLERVQAGAKREKGDIWKPKQITQPVIDSKNTPFKI